MAVSVDQFVFEYKEKFRNSRGFQRLISDLDYKYGVIRTADIVNFTVAKLILGHHYDSIIEQPISKAFREFANKHTDFCANYV